MKTLSIRGQRWRWTLPAALLLAQWLTILPSTAVAATDNPGPHTATIKLIDSKGEATPIGTVNFSGWHNGASGIAVTIEGEAFSDHFLSMRPFRCIEGASEWFCYLPYPYETRATITRDDLTDLSYALLFIRKKPADFGIDAWNGLYYQLQRQADGSITGELFEGDFNVLASPPDKKYARPIDTSEFIKASKTKRLFPRLIIK